MEENGGGRVVRDHTDDHVYTLTIERFLGITADEGHGGLAMGYQAHCVVMEEISRASGTLEPE